MNQDAERWTAAREHNRRAWDLRARQRLRFTRPARDDDVRDPQAKLDVAWLGDVSGRALLCLGAGGGRQSALYAAAGARVTVVDISPEMLAIDREVARERGFDVRLVEASIDDLSALAPASFEFVVQPVSTCYVPDVTAVYRQVARVTAPGGMYVSQHKQPASLQAGVSPSAAGYELSEPYYRAGPLPPAPACLHREEGTLEFLHRWEDLIGGLCRSGFVIEDLCEPFHAEPGVAVGSFEHRSAYVPPYVRIKARRGATAAPLPPTGETPLLWTPGS